MDGDGPFATAEALASRCLSARRPPQTPWEDWSPASAVNGRVATQATGELGRRIQITSGENEALVVQSKTVSEPFGSRRGPRHDEQVADLMDGGFPVALSLHTTRSS